jgi:hypothetical protein
VVDSLAVPRFPSPAEGLVPALGPDPAEGAEAVSSFFVVDGAHPAASMIRPINMQYAILK